MRVLLTGANGFIGSEIAARLTAAGHQVRAAVRDPGKFQRRFPGCEAVAADLNDMSAAENWRPYLAGIDAIINCAGALHSRGGQHLARIHRDSPIALFTAAAQAGVRKIVQISAVSVGADTEYAESKRAADEALQHLAVEWVILRPSIVYDQRAYGGTAMLRALAACPFVIPVIGNGVQSATPIHTADLARTVLMAVETPRLDRRIVAPCGPETLTLADMCRIYRDWLGLAPAPLLHVPRAAVALAALIGDLIGNGPVTTTSLRQLEFGNAADPAAFIAAVGFTPQHVADALALTPSATGDLWQARLYLLRPLINSALIVLWAISGAIGLGTPAAAIAGQFPMLGALAAPVGYGASIVDLAIAALLLTGRWPRLAFAAQLIMVIGYTLALTLAQPQLWANLYGPLLKNLPIVALILVQRVLQEER